MANPLSPSTPVAAPGRTWPIPRLHVCLLVAVSLLWSGDLAVCDASSIRRPGTSRKTAASSRPDAPSLLLPAHCRPNQFVAAGPLAVAVVCRDGVVLAAFHTSPALEPLLMGAAAAGDELPTCATSEEQGEATCNEGGQGGDEKKTLEDLPRAYRGPFRVAPIDGHGTALLTAGWRTDCLSLAAKCRSLAAEEASSYGLGSGSGSGNNDGSNGDDGAAGVLRPDYATGIASDASLWLARCAISGGIRALNCVGLLASCTRTSTHAKSQGIDGKGDAPTRSARSEGCLYLIDAAGIHRVRALAIGLGSERINRRLVGVDFSSLGKDAAVRKLMDIIVQEGTAEKDGGEDEGEEDDDAPEENGKERDDNGWQLPKGSRVELAFVDARQMRRINQRIVQVDAS